MKGLKERNNKLTRREMAVMLGAWAFALGSLISYLMLKTPVSFGFMFSSFCVMIWIPVMYAVIGRQNNCFHDKVKK